MKLALARLPATTSGYGLYLALAAAGLVPCTLVVTPVEGQAAWHGVAADTLMSLSRCSTSAKDGLKLARCRQHSLISLRSAGEQLAGIGSRFFSTPTAMMICRCQPATHSPLGTLKATGCVQLRCSAGHRPRSRVCIAISLYIAPAHLHDVVALAPWLAPSEALPQDAAKGPHVGLLINGASAEHLRGHVGCCACCTLHR